MLNPVIIDEHSSVSHHWHFHPVGSFKKKMSLHTFSQRPFSAVMSVLSSRLVLLPPSGQINSECRLNKDLLTKVIFLLLPLDAV